MTRAIGLLLCASLLCAGCATAGGGAIGPASAAGVPRADPALMASYTKQLPIGSRVRVDLASGGRVRGTLMKADDRAIVVQPRTRIPEAPIEIAVNRIEAIELERNNGGIGKSIAIGVAAGAGGALGVLMILAALISD
jgi:hypothetical protein